MHILACPQQEVICTLRMKMETWICCERTQHFNSSAMLFLRSLRLTRVCLSQLALPLCTLPSIYDPPPRSSALTPSCRPSVSAPINPLSRLRPPSWRWTSQLFPSPLPTPSPALFLRPLPRAAPSIDHASNSRAASLDLSLPSAHPPKTLISISCLHPVSSTRSSHSLCSLSLFSCFLSLVSFSFCGFQVDPIIWHLLHLCNGIHLVEPPTSPPSNFTSFYFTSWDLSPPPFPSSLVSVTSVISNVILALHCDLCALGRSNWNYSFAFPI